MSYLNRMLIEEDMQFECYGIMDCTSLDCTSMDCIECKWIPYGIWRILGQLTGLFPLSNAILEKIMNDQSDTTIGHLIFSANFAVSSRDIHGTNIHASNVEYCDEIACSELTSNPLMITRLGGERLQCIQKQQYKDIYRYGGRISTGITDVDKSIGDDIENFYNRMKANEINICMQYSKLDKITLTDQITSLDPLNDSVRTFHVSMLTDNEENKMSFKTIDQTRWGSIEFFKHYSELSNHEQNYALSLCARRTFFLANLNRYQELILFDNWERDDNRLLNPIPPSDSRVSLHWTPKFCECCTCNSPLRLRMFD